MGERAIHHRTCHLCEACCGIEVHVADGAVTAIRPNPRDPLSRGHICPKATAIADIQADPDRLRAPMKRTGTGWQTLDWDTALDEVAARLADVMGRHGTDAVASYSGNPSAHNYAVTLHASGLLRHLSRRNRFSASTVDQMPHQLVSHWLYGHMAMFPIPDVDRTAFMLIVGGNPLASNGSMWTVPDVRQRLTDLKARGGRLVVVDPRRTETAKIASEHLFIRPGQDAAFLAGLLLALDDQGLAAPDRLAPMLEGWEAVWSALRQTSLATMANVCGIGVDDIRRLARDFAAAPSAVCYGRMGVSVQQHGTLCQWLIHLVNIATGNLDRPGGVMFATPAVDLLPHTNPGGWNRWASRVSGHPEACGELPAACMAEEMLTPGDGQIRALVTIAGNPVLSTPNGRQLDRALAGLDFMVSIDSYLNETTRHAHYILPPAGPLERSKYDLLFYQLSVRNVARFSPPTLPRTPGALHDWEIITRLGERLARLLGREQKPALAPEAMLDASLKAGPYGLGLAQLAAQPDGIDLGPLQPRLPERLFTPDKRIRLAPAPLLAELDRFLATTREARPQGAGRGLLLIGRRHVRSNNSWMHNYQRLVKGPDRCTLMIHPDDARQRNLGHGARARLASRVGAVDVTVEVTEDIMPGVVSLPHGWGHNRPGVRLGIATAHAGVSINDVTDETLIDPLSGNAAVTAVPVEVSATNG